MNKYMTIFLFSLVSFICIQTGCSKKGDDNPVGPVSIGEIACGTPATNIEEFEAVMERLRGQLLIPGMSAAITKNGEIVWASGFGWASREANKPATPTTAYHLASLTKTFASTVIMQLVEEGLLDLETPVSEYGISLSSPGTIRVKHLLTHTSEGQPGTNYRYNGGRFGLLDDVIIGASGRTFADLLMERIVEPLGLERTVPNVLNPTHCPLRGNQLAAFIENLAQGYTSDGSRPEAYPTYFGTAAGLISSAIDMAKYSIAIDNHTFLTPETQNWVFTPTVSTHGDSLPYGLGWFVQRYRGVKLIWHYGWWTANSSLIIKVPQQDIAFVILANTEMLSGTFPGLGYGDVTVSVVAMEFLNAFVFGNGILPDDPIDY